MAITRIVNGAPTSIDVNKLIKKFGTPSAGQSISYSDIANAIGHMPQSNRWHTVVQSWRKKLYRENNVLFEAVPGEALRVLDNHDRVTYSTKKQEYGRRHIQRGAIAAVRTERDGLSEGEKQTLDHAVMNGAALKLAFLAERRRIKAPE